jgi:hypothetical protein
MTLGELIGGENNTRIENPLILSLSRTVKVKFCRGILSNLSPVPVSFCSFCHEDIYFVSRNASTETNILQGLGD